MCYTEKKSRKKNKKTAGFMRHVKKHIGDADTFSGPLPVPVSPRKDTKDLAGDTPS